MGVRMAATGTDLPSSPPPRPTLASAQAALRDSCQACVLLIGLIFIAGELVSGLR